MAMAGAWAVAIGMPWALLLSAGLMGGVFTFSVKSNKKILENDLKEHPDNHRFSPNLQAIVDRLYKASGLNIWP